MADRITDKHLEGLIGRLNKLTGMPESPYMKQADGTFKPMAGCYHLSHAYGGVSLHRMSMTEGCTGVTEPLSTGVTEPLSTGHITKRDLYERIYAYILGIESVKFGD